MSFFYKRDACVCSLNETTPYTIVFCMVSTSYAFLGGQFVGTNGALIADETES